MISRIRRPNIRNALRPNQVHLKNGRVDMYGNPGLTLPRNLGDLEEYLKSKTEDDEDSANDFVHLDLSNCSLIGAPAKIML